jgi:ketosteroid isomerase-like protein
MRRKIGLLLLIGTLGIVRGNAQDAASTPFRETPPAAESPAPSPPPAATPTPPPVRKAEAASPAPASTATPPPVRKAEAASSAAPENAPVRAAQPVTHPSIAPVRAMSPKPANAKSAPKPEQQEPASETEAQRSEASGNIEDRIKDLEREWETAISKHQPAIIERVVADDFVGVSSTGRIGDKETLLAEAKRDKNSYKTAKTQQMTVHVYGSHVAVVLGMTKESGVTGSGRTFDHTYRFTDTWIERGGKWQCVAAHAAVATKR